MSYLDKLKLEPYGFQKEAIEFHLKTPYSFNGYTMGLGKSLIAVSVLLEKSKTPLIVCPAYLQQNWVDEIEKYLVKKPKIKVIKSVVNYESSIDFYIVSYSSFMKAHKLFPHVDAVVCDEVTKLKNKKAARTKNFESYIVEHRPKRLLLMSGTPVTNHIIDFHQLLRFVWYGGRFPEFNKFGEKKSKYAPRSRWDRGYYAFLGTFCHQNTNGFGKQWYGFKNKELMSKMLRKVYIRKRTNQVIDLPATVNKTVRLNKKNKLDAELLAAWETFKKTNKEIVFATLKAKMALFKVDATIELAKEMLEEGEKVIVFTCHLESAKTLADKLNAYLVTGATNSKLRQGIIKKFGEHNGPTVLVGTVGSMSEGFTITSTSRMIFNDLPWTPSELSQARKRIHRIGQTKTCFYYYILASDIDYQIYNTVTEKAKMISEAINV